MTDKIRELILYPVIVDTISTKQKLEIAKIFDISEQEVNELLKSRIEVYEINSIVKELDKEKRLECFKTTKKILEIEKISMTQLMALAELGRILEIDEKETGFDFNIYDSNEIIDVEFNRALTNFSMISSVIGFIPFIPFSDYFILTPLQIALVTKIFNLYNFEMTPQDFLKAIGATAGIGLIFKGMSRLITNFVPFLGWIVNASIGFAGTYAIGIVARRYALEKGNISKENIKEIWEQSFEDGKKEFEKLKKFILEKKDLLFKEFKNYKEKYEQEDNKEQKINKQDLDQENKKEERSKRRSKKSKNIEEENMFR